MAELDVTAVRRVDGALALIAARAGRPLVPAATWGGLRWWRFAASTPPRFFFFTAPATTEIYTLSLHDALPIFEPLGRTQELVVGVGEVQLHVSREELEDRKRTRLNSSHGSISYAVFCLKK